MSAYTIKPIQVEIFTKIEGLEDLEEVLKNVESIKEKHSDIVVTIRAQKKEKYLSEVGEKSEEQALKHRKTYKFQMGNGTKSEVEIETKIEDLDKADLEEILHEFATCTHNFYLSLGKRITDDI